MSFYAYFTRKYLERSKCGSLGYKILLSLLEIHILFLEEQTIIDGEYDEIDV